MRIKDANKLVDRMNAMSREFIKDGRIDELIALLDDPERAVRLSAAGNLLDTVPERAVPVLEALENGPRGGIAVMAFASLWMWRQEQEKP